MGTNFNKEGKLQRDESKTKWIKLLVEERMDHKIITKLLLIELLFIGLSFELITKGNSEGKWKMF